MNINDWKTIQTRNDIKYIKRKLMGSSVANWSLVIDVFLLLLAFVLDCIFAEQDSPNVIWVIIGICGVTIPVALLVLEVIITKRKESISRKVTNVRELVSMFDDEICYMIMSAETFSTSLKSNYCSIDSKQKALLQEFFYIEAGYYLNKAVKLILKMDNNISVVVDEDDISKNRISKKRLVNAICLIVSIYEEVFQSLQTQAEQLKAFSVCLDPKAMQECYMALKEFVTDKSSALSINIDKTFNFEFKVN